MQLLPVAGNNLTEIKKNFEKEGLEMKKLGLLFLALVILGGYAVKDSEAGQSCWQFEGLSDYIKLTVSKPDSKYPAKALHGMWYHPGDYIIPLTGTMVKSADGTQRLLTLNGTKVDEGALDQAYQMQAVIDNITQDGTLFIFYVVPETNVNFSIIKVNCGTLPAP